MQFGVSLPNNYGVEDVQEILDLASQAEDLGYHSVWVSEHLLNVAYVFERLGNRPYYEPLTVLTAVAAATTRVRLGTSVLVLPYHHPIRLAKTVATLDAISGGRVILGVGVGVIKEEFEALGSPYRERGAVTDEIIAAMRALWTREDPEFSGRHYAFTGTKFSPKPVQKPHPPIWIGGASRAAIRRAATVGDGWHPIRLTPAAYGRTLREVRQQASAAGRQAGSLATSIRVGLDPEAPCEGKPPDERAVLSGTPEEVAQTVRAYGRAGVETLVLDLHSRDVPRIQKAIEWFAREVLPACVSG
jgi:probable F420-dependent oxidoreductase